MTTLDVWLPRTTRERLRSTIRTLADPTGTPPEWAFSAEARYPGDAPTWWPAVWVGASVERDGVWVTETDGPVMGGPGSGATVELAVGRWYMWVRLTDVPEYPDLPAGVVAIT